MILPDSNAHVVAGAHAKTLFFLSSGRAPASFNSAGLDTPPLYDNQPWRLEPPHSLICRRRSSFQSFDMAKIYKDTRVDLRPYSPNTVVNVQIPNQAVTSARARFSISSVTGQDETIAKDEDEFAKRYLATQGSIHFRKRSVYPRTFLWRVVNDNKVLEIQCVDLTKGGVEHHEYNNTLRLDFQEEILPSGVDLADLEDHEVLSVFVITASKQLHTLTLRPEFFRRAAAIDEKISDWCKSCVPAPLSFSYPHRLHASSPLELFISLDNGSLLRLTRRSGDDGNLRCLPCVWYLDLVLILLLPRYQLDPAYLRRENMGLIDSRPCPMACAAFNQIQRAHS